MNVVMSKIVGYPIEGNKVMEIKGNVYSTYSINGIFLLPLTHSNIKAKIIKTVPANILYKNGAI